MATACEALTKAGVKCKKNAMEGSRYCHVHHNKDDATPAVSNSNDTSPMKSEFNPVFVEEVKPANAYACDEVFQLDVQIKAWKEQIKLAQKKKRAVSNGIKSYDKVTRKALLLFYHDNKARADIVSYLKDKLGELQFPVGKNPPWQLVKRATDSVFVNLEDADKSVYMAMAKTALLM